MDISLTLLTNRPQVLHSADLEAYAFLIIPVGSAIDCVRSQFPFEVPGSTGGESR